MTARSNLIVGVDDVGGPPVPIPNTEVKPYSAENTWLATARENRKMPTLEKCPPNRVGVFLFGGRFSLYGVLK